MLPPLAGRAELVGRQQEFERLRELVFAALDGRGQSAVLSGEAGIGKTRLLEETCALAAARGALVRLGEGRQPEQTRPFGAASDALGVSLGATDQALAELAGEIYARPTSVGHLGDVAVEEHYLAERLAGVFEVLCNSSPMCLAVENLHWCDSSTLLLLGRLVEICGQYATLLIFTTRPTERPEVGALLASLAGRSGLVMDLGPLDGGSVAALASHFIGAPPGPSLEAQLARATGNPLFVVELVSAMVAQGSVQVARSGKAEVKEGQVPPTLSAAVLRRLNMLPESTVELLRRAALLGPVVNLDELAAWTGRSALEMSGPLRVAASAGLVGAQGGELTFRHELVHDALYNDWLPPVRKALHRDLGHALARAGAPSYRVAYHLEVGAGPEDEEAMAWLHRAGLEVAPRAPLEGVQLLKRAVELAPRGSPLLDVIRTDLAVALVWAGNIAEGEHLAHVLVTEATSAEVRGRAARYLSFSLMNRYRLLDAKEVCSRALAAGVAPATTKLLLELTDTTAALMLGMLPSGQGVAAAVMEELVARAAALGDPRTYCDCLVGLVLAEANEGYLDQAASHGSQAVREVESLPPTEIVMAPAHIVYVWVLEEQDRFDEALAALERREQLAGPLPFSLGAALSATLTGRVHFAAGRWDDALTDLAPVVGWQYSEGWADMLVLRALIELHRDELAQARSDIALVDEVLASGGGCSSMDYLTSARAFLLEADGQPEKALEQLRGLWQLTEAIPYAMAKPKIGPQLARLCMALGDPRMARTVAAQLEALSSSNPSVARLAGAALWCRGIAEHETSLLLDGVELYRQSGRPLEKGLVCEDAAAALAAEGSVEQARILLGEALEYYDDLFAAQRGASARARLRALGARVGTRGPRRRPSTGWEALTGAEQRVALLVAERLSNPEIAERLFVSRRTVETHVSNALAKLGCVSRRELAATVRARSG
jgi:DNA-binding CsgD family transcriptional regulator